MTRNIVLGLVVGLLVACATVGAMAQPPERDRYIVVLNPNAGASAAVAEAVARRHNGQVGFVYQHALLGVSIALPPQALSGLRRDGRIKYVERDDPVQLFDQITSTGIDRSYNPDVNGTQATGLTINGIDDYRVDVDVAIIDTGIDHRHPDLNVVAGTIEVTNMSLGDAGFSQADFSNRGHTIDVTALGVCIISTYLLEKGEYATIDVVQLIQPDLASDRVSTFTQPLARRWGRDDTATVLMTTEEIPMIWTVYLSGEIQTKIVQKV